MWPSHDAQDDLEGLDRPPSDEDFAGWPDAPLLMRAAPLPYQQLESGIDPCAIRVNDGRCVHVSRRSVRLHKIRRGAEYRREMCSS